jgi:hypothetical protein
MVTSTAVKDPSAGAAGRSRLVDPRLHVQHLSAIGVGGTREAQSLPQYRIFDQGRAHVAHFVPNSPPDVATEGGGEGFRSFAVGRVHAGTGGLLTLLPDIRLEVPEHTMSADGQFGFSRWVMRATGANGQFALNRMGPHAGPRWTRLRELHLLRLGAVPRTRRQLRDSTRWCVRSHR